MLYNCIKCKRTIELNEGYVNISYNIEKMSKNPITLRDEIKMHKSSNIITLCASCGNKHQANSLKEHLQVKEKVYDYGVLESHIVRLLLALGLDNKGFESKRIFIMKIAKSRGMTLDQFNNIMLNLDNKRVVTPSTMWEKVNQVCELIDLLFMDGSITSEEMDYLTNIGKLYGVSDQYIGDMILKESVFRNMVAIAKSDGEMSESQYDFIKRILSNTALDNEINRERIFNLHSKQYTTFVPSKRGEKMLHINMFVDLAIIDGKLSMEAMRMIRKLGTEAYKLPDEDILEIINKKVNPDA